MKIKWIYQFIFLLNKILESPNIKIRRISLLSGHSIYIYRLFAYGKNNTLVYINTAFIPDYKTSVFMNSIFRNIKENKNLDYIEESDDEEDFQNINEDKYVDLHKKVQMECVFHYKFKRWVPKKLVKQQRIVHVNQLMYYK